MNFRGIIGGLYMYNLSDVELRLIKKYQHDIDGLIDVIKVICNDAYDTGYEQAVLHKEGY